MTYTQITPHERYTLSTLRQLGYTGRAIARILDRSPSTISREVRRNAWRQDGRSYVPRKAQSYTNERRRVSRRNSQFSATEWALVESVLREDFIPEQVVGWFTRFKILAISHETIYGRSTPSLGTASRVPASSRSSSARPASPRWDSWRGGQRQS